MKNEKKLPRREPLSIKHLFPYSMQQNNDDEIQTKILQQ